MGLLSMFKNLNLGFGMLQMPTTTSADTIEAKELQEVEHDNTVRLAGDHHEITSVDKDTGIRSDETGSCTIGMDWKFNHPSREENVEGKLEEAVSGQRRLARFKGAQGLGNIIASSENVGQIEFKLNFLGLPIRPGEKECAFYMRTGGCKFARLCRFHHPDPTAVVGDSFQDRKNDVPSRRHGPVEQLCETPRPSENSSNEQTAFLGPATPNRGLLQNVYWNGNQTATSPLHPREMNVNDLRKTLINKDTAYEVSGGVESQQFEVYPQRPAEPECQHFMKTGYCKFKSACRYHHPKSNVSFLGLPQRPVSNNYQHRGPVEQLRETPLPSENTSNEQTALLGPSSSYVPDLLTPNQGLKPNAQWNGNQTATSPLHPREMNVNDLRKTLANKDTPYEFSGGVESQQFEEYPQRPGEPECQHFTKTGYCKFKSACRYHHPKSNVSFLGLPQRPHHGPVEQLRETPLPSENTSNEQTAFLSPSSSYVPDLLTPNQGLKPNAQWNGNQTVTSLLHPPEIKKIDQQKELANKDAAYEVSGGEPQQFDEYPQRPSEPECQYFMRTGYCKFKSACRFHHPPKSNPSFLGLPLRPASNNYKQDGPVEQLCEMPLPPESTSNEQTAFVCQSSSNVADLFTPNWGLQPNVQWNGDQTVTSLLHPPELKIIDQQKELANKDAAYEVSGGEPQQFDKYPQRPSEPECQYFMKTGYCKFKSECRFHHPKSNPSFLGLALRPASNNDKQDGPVEQWCEMPLPSESTSNEQTAFVCPSSSDVAGLFSPNRGLQPNVQWNGDQMATSPLHPPEIKINEEGQELANKDAAYEFSGGLKSQRFNEYPQRPSEPECQYFMKTGYCMFKSACRCHHPKSNLSFPDPPPKPMDTSPLHPPDIKINEQGQELANKDTAYEFIGGMKLQQFDEYPQRPSEPECHHFMKTGYCKFKSACRCHHPKSNLSSPAPPPKPDKPICTHYSRRGICKFGSACRFNHHMERT